MLAAVLLLTLATALAPNAQTPDRRRGDKTNHIAASVTLSACAAMALTRARLRTSAPALSAFGAAIEGLQALPLIARDAEWADWYADTAAAVLALLLVMLVRSATSSVRRE